ncbi:hypothetical protein PSI9734_00109 [Pseudidiomarina piscicola]|uniref:Uncharacterized protein n=1 Tax=Pseudidiomarina piscicola TaxID=2614830 RepID=A0A6S6WJH7_9GAMM|nr:hypothetical protein [Pseudidiomarina piscicola]CAB0149545.1 hypothetical protein PSI9734_00109 [Pseudidiomarina piscicola]VZT38993.1 hypothetical protein PSI9734_00109 [Pseudomonas aeruginosa]
MIEFSFVIMVMAGWSNDLAVPATNTPLQQQLKQVSELRIEELEELKSAAQVRRLQHQLQVAQLRQQITEVTTGQVTATGPQPSTSHGLDNVNLLSVVRNGQQVTIWLQRGEKRFSVQPNRSNGEQLQVQLQRDELILRQAGEQRRFYLQGDW